jgi:Tol biopolymer transport system component/DNA-binding winged helix-turn-helix (wHTH) protein
MSNEVSGLYEFGGFRFNTETNTLWRDGELISLSPKALELLRLLVEKQGEIVSKQEIFDRVWANTFVEEGVLTQNIYTLRRALGNDENGRPLIENIARRGYHLTVPIRALPKQDAQTSQINPDSAEILLATQTRTEIITEEFIEDSPKQISGKTPLYRRKFFVLAAAGFAIFLIAGFFLYLFPPRKLVSVFSPPATEMEFQRLTDTGDIAYLVISPDGEFVAFSRGKDIFLKDLRSAGETKLNIEQTERGGFLQFSADSAFIFFGSNSNPNSAGKVFRVSRFGGAAKLVAENVWSGFSLSPDGGTLAFHRKFPNENRWVLILKNLETGSERELAERRLPEEYYWNNYPAWSADGRKIVAVVISRTEHFLRLVVIDTETGKEEEIKTLNFRNVEQILWSATGDSLIASANTGDNFQLWRIDYPGGEVSRITHDLNSYLGLTITKDGKKLLARQRIYYSNIWVGNQTDLNDLRQLTVGTSRNDGLKGLTWLGNEKVIYASNAEKLRDWNLWSVNLNDSTRQELTLDAETQNEEPTVSPDGRTIYFSSNRATSAHIWQVDIDGGNLRQITFNEKETELYPQISPDGAWLYYIQKGQHSSAIWRKSLIDERKEKLTDERKLSPDTFLALSPDGKRLAFQNLTAKPQIGEKPEDFKVGIIGTENPQDARFFNLADARQFIKWSGDGDSFDYVTDPLEGAQIWRQRLDENSKPTLILNVPKDDIFNFAWSKDGQHLSIARGQLLRDAVLLANFDE